MLEPQAQATLATLQHITPCRHPTASIGSPLKRLTRRTVWQARSCARRGAAAMPTLLCEGCCVTVATRPTAAGGLRAVPCVPQPELPGSLPLRQAPQHHADVRGQAMPATRLQFKKFKCSHRRNGRHTPGSLTGVRKICHSTCTVSRAWTAHIGRRGGT